MPSGEQFVSTTATTGMPSLLASETAMYSVLMSITNKASGRAAHVLDSGEAAVEFFPLTLQLKTLLLVQTLHGVLVEHRIELFEPVDGVLYSFVVGEHAAQPAMIHIGHAAANAFVADGVARLTLGADKQNLAAVRRHLAEKIQGLAVHRQSLLEVDDVNLVALPEDIGSHFGVPVAGLVSEVHASFQHLTHRNVSHFVSPFGFLCHGLEPPTLEGTRTIQLFPCVDYGNLRPGFL